MSWCLSWKLVACLGGPTRLASLSLSCLVVYVSLSSSTSQSVTVEQVPMHQQQPTRSHRAADSGEITTIRPVTTGIWADSNTRTATGSTDADERPKSGHMHSPIQRQQPIKSIRDDSRVNQQHHHHLRQMQMQQTLMRKGFEVFLGP